MFMEFFQNFTHNLFKPLLLFFYLGFAIPILKVPLEFPKALYQSLTIYLLLAIGWHGGEELASLSASGFQQAAGFMVLGFVTNLIIGLAAYQLLKRTTRLRKIDAATVAGYYGSDSAGTFVTCLGVLTAANMAYAAYMPVLLAVMEIPGCLVALMIVSKLRQHGMDINGNMPGEPNYAGSHKTTVATAHISTSHIVEGTTNKEAQCDADHQIDSVKVWHEVLLNPGLYLLFGGVLIGFIGRLQGRSVTNIDDELFVNLFHGVLCLFLLEMGMTACRRLHDLKQAGWRFTVFAVFVPNVFAAIGICFAHVYSYLIGVPFDIGTYALFSVLCAAASYIAVPAVQRIAIPEASPTLPLAASLGLTFTYNVTIGIPVYILFAQQLVRAFPIS